MTLTTIHPQERPLTRKQLEILEFIEEEVSRTGRPPTYRAIAMFCKVESVATIQDHVVALVRKGYLEREPGVARGFVLRNRSESIDVPILGSVPAGRPIEAIAEAQGSLSIARKWSGDLFALKVKGDSMIDAGIFEGDYVIVRKQETAEHGEIVVALLGGEATVKRLEKKGGRMRLIPENPKYAPIEIGEADDGRISGRVVALQRHYGK